MNAASAWRYCTLLIVKLYDAFCLIYHSSFFILTLVSSSKLLILKAIPGACFSIILMNADWNMSIRKQIGNFSDCVTFSRFRTQKQPPEVFYKKGVLKNVAKFTGKHSSWSFFFNKVAGLSPATLLKKRLQHKGFPVNLYNFL